MKMAQEDEVARAWVVALALVCRRGAGERAEPGYKQFVARG